MSISHKSWVEKSDLLLIIINSMLEVIKCF